MCSGQGADIITGVWGHNLCNPGGGGLPGGEGQVSDHDSPVKVVLNLRFKQGGGGGRWGNCGSYRSSHL